MEPARSRHTCADDIHRDEQTPHCSLIRLQSLQRLALPGLQLREPVLWAPLAPVLEPPLVLALRAPLGLALWPQLVLALLLVLGPPLALPAQTERAVAKCLMVPTVLQQRLLPQTE